MIGGKKQQEGDGFAAATGTFRGDRVTFVARRVIVKLDTDGDAAAIADACAHVMDQVDDGATMLRGPSTSGRMVIEVPDGDSVPTWANNVSKLDGVVWSEPDVLDRIQLTPNDPRYGNQWSADVVRAEEAWDLTTGADNVIIGIIDSGISMSVAGALDHEDLNDSGRITLGTDFVDGGTPRDTNSHGTHVLGIAAAPGNSADGIAGMNWHSPVYICRTLDANGGGSSADFADAVEEITDFAVAAGKKAVINYSAGGSDNNTKRDACEYASDRGMLLVAATGNDNGGPVISPAVHSVNFPGVIAVGSTDADDSVSSFSNVGPEVTVVAPGRDIWSTTPTQVIPGVAQNYDEFNGTSMATPLVSGLAALVWSHKPNLTNEEVRDCIKDSAVELGPGSFDNDWGFGRVDAKAALDCGLVFQPVPPTKLKPLCGLPTTALCGISRLQVLCPTKAPVACPNTRLKKCFSHIICMEPTTKLCPTSLAKDCQVPISRLNILCDGGPITRLQSCPSAIDACPSAPGGCVDRFPENLVPERFSPSPLELRLAELEARLAEVEQPASDEEDDEDIGWFFVDDDGEIHEL